MSLGMFRNRGTRGCSGHVSAAACCETQRMTLQRQPVVLKRVNRQLGQAAERGEEGCPMSREGSKERPTLFIGLPPCALFATLFPRYDFHKRICIGSQALQQVVDCNDSH